MRRLKRPGTNLTPPRSAWIGSLPPLRYDLSGLTELSDAAAESLSKHEGELNLGLTELSDAAAEALSKHEGEINSQDPKEWAESLRK